MKTRKKTKVMLPLTGLVTQKNRTERMKPRAEAETSKKAQSRSKIVEGRLEIQVGGGR